MSASQRVTQPLIGSRLTLTRRADAAALSAVLAEAGRRGWRDVDIAPVQSFRMMQAAHHLATLVTGEATVPGAVNAGCFLAVVKDGEVGLISTVGVGDYEAETCIEPLAVGLLSSRAPVRFGTVFRAASPNAMVLEPIVINWDRSNNTLLIDDAMSTKASQAGAQTIAAMKKLL